MSDEPSSKKSKAATADQVSDGDVKKNDDQMAVADPALPIVQENRCEIFKLNVDCCEELFEWLPIEDLLALGQTCKRMNRIAGLFFRQHYPNAIVKSVCDGIYFGSIQLNNFTEFIVNIDVINLNRVANIIGSCQSLKKIQFNNLDVTRQEKNLHLIRDVLAKVESVSIVYKHRLNENILDFCPNSKQLRAHFSHTEWLYKLHKCPQLEHISLGEIKQMIDVEEFFDQIPNVRSMKVNWQFILTNREAVLGSEVELDDLIIDWRNIAGNGRLMCHVLNELHQRGFYKRLHLLKIGYLDQRQMNQLVSFHALETLCIYNFQRDVIWLVMESVKKIAIGQWNTWDAIDLTPLASKFPNLQCICLLDKSMKSIRPLVRELKHLSRIIVISSIPSYENILDLSVLNKERETLAGACKVEIHVPENTFLATKFAISTSRSLIEMKRRESNELSSLWYLH